MTERFNIKDRIEDVADAKWARRLPKNRFGWSRRFGARAVPFKVVVASMKFRKLASIQGKRISRTPQPAGSKETSGFPGS